MMREFKGKTRMVTIASSIMLGTIASMDLLLLVARTVMTSELQFNIVIIAFFCSADHQLVARFFSTYLLDSSAFNSKVHITLGILMPADPDSRLSGAWLLEWMKGNRAATLLLNFTASFTEG